MAYAFIYISAVALVCAFAGYLNNGAKFLDEDMKLEEERYHKRRQGGM